MKTGEARVGTQASINQIDRIVDRDVKSDRIGGVNAPTKIGDLGYDHWISDHVLVRINIVVAGYPSGNANLGGSGVGFVMLAHRLSLPWKPESGCALVESLRPAFEACFPGEEYIFEYIHRRCST